MFSISQENINMADSRYSIKDLENYTQIKAHTILIWEQRYKLLQPKRTETNIRYYGDDDLKKILNINLLYINGYKISKIASLSENEILEEARSIISTQHLDFKAEIDQIILATLAFDGDKIISILEGKEKELTLPILYTNLIIPLLQRVGKLWQINSFEIIHEHYLSNIIRAFFTLQINQIESINKPTKNAVLFLHSDEQHELSLMMFNYILKKKGFKCHYFGQNVPMDEIDLAVNKLSPDIIVTVFVADIKEKNFEKIMDDLTKLTKNSTVVISGRILVKNEELVPKQLNIVNRTEDLDKILKRI